MRLERQNTESPAPATAGIRFPPAIAAGGAGLVVPVAMSLLLGWYGAGPGGGSLGAPMSILFWLLVLVPTWLAFEAGCWAVSYVMRPLTPKFSVVIVLGSILGGLAIRPFILFLIGYYNEAFLGAPGPLQAPQFVWSLEWMTGFVQEALVVLLLWAATNLLMRGPLGISRFGYTATSKPGAKSVEEPSAAPEPPDFTKRLKEKAEGPIQALVAEDHYIHVHTGNGSEMIHYRFADAVSELAATDGLQVHRSYWVNRSAVNKVVPRGRSFDIILDNGMTVPVGQTFKQAVAQGLRDLIVEE